MPAPDTHESAALARLDRILARELDADVVEWLADAFARHLAGAPLDVALRLDRASRIRARDQALIEAARALGPRPSCWLGAVALAQAVRRFKSRVLPFVHDGRELGPVERALWAAWRAYPRLPATPQGLQHLLK